MTSPKNAGQNIQPTNKTLNCAINSHFVNDKASKVRSAAMDTKVNLWKAVRLAKNLNYNTIPSNLTLGGCQLLRGKWLSRLQGFFNDKIKSNVLETNIDPSSVYNGLISIVMHNE